MNALEKSWNKDFVIICVPLRKNLNSFQITRKRAQIRGESEYDMLNNEKIVLQSQFGDVFLTLNIF